MSKYTHRITVPFTATVILYIDSDEPCESADDAYKLATEELDELCVNVEVTGTDERDGEIIDVGEGVQFHKSIVEGNTVNASVPDINWETEDGDG